MSIIGDVSRYIHNKNGDYCHIADMVKDLGYTAEQIRGAINSKRHEDPTWAERVKIVTRGSTWAWIMQKVDVVTTHKVDALITTKKTRNVFEQIGTTKNGDLILQNEDGDLFRATELS